MKPFDMYTLNIIWCAKLYFPHFCPKFILLEKSDDLGTLMFHGLMSDVRMLRLITSSFTAPSTFQFKRSNLKNHP